MHKEIVVAVALLVAGMTLAASQHKWGFDKDKVGETPKGFDASVGKWTVVIDDSPPTKPHVLAQQARNGNPVFNVCLVEDTSVRDCELSVKFRAISGNDDQGGGLVWRARDAKNYYLCRYNPLENNCRIYKVVDGRRSQLQSADIAAKPGWHTLRVSVKGSQMVCYYDGMKYIEITDDTFKGKGMIGLWSKADAVTYFDDLTVEGE